MSMLCRILSVIILFTSCVQIEAESNPSVQESVTQRQTRTTPRRSFNYRVEATTQIVGFHLMVNGVGLLSSDGGTSVSTEVNINDWMVSGNNDVSITIIWPDGIDFSPGTGSARFRFFSNNSLIKDISWPASGIQDIRASYPHTFNDSFRSSGFPRVLLERSERVISSFGVLPRDDQAEIIEIAVQLRRAFIEKNIESINNLLGTKYEDLARAHFTTAAEIRAEENAKFQELMSKEGYTVVFSGRNSFSSVADDRVVRLGQGRLAFHEPAIIINYRENRRSERFTMELYFAKIDGNWVIIR